MPRKIVLKTKLPQEDNKYKSILVSLLINKVLKNGKKLLAKSIVYTVLNNISIKSGKNPLNILELAVRNTRPLLKTKMIRRNKYVAFLMPKFASVNFSLRWLISSAHKRNGNSFITKLTNEIIDASKNLGASVKKRAEIHKIAQSYRSFVDILK